MNATMSDVNMNDVKKLLVEARAFIETGWTQFHMARDKSGTPRLAIDRRASAWCMVGALHAAAYKFYFSTKPCVDVDEADLFLKLSLIHI